MCSAGRFQVVARSLALLAAAACVGAASQSFPLEVIVAPGASGSIQVERLETGERMLLVELEHVPPPCEVSPGARAFVVWLHSGVDTPVRAGVMSYDPKARSGSLLATAPGERFTVRITTEANEDIEQPSDALVAEKAVAFN